MIRTIATVAAVALTGLAGCTTWTPQTDATGQQFSYRAGSGVVESIARAPLPLTSGAGGTAPAPSDGVLYRLGIRMDDGRLQYIDTDSTEFMRGTRVRLTDQRLIEKL
jgi:hypothetical protein